MTVKEMIQQLVSLPMNAQVVLLADEARGYKVTGIHAFSRKEVPLYVTSCQPLSLVTVEGSTFVELVPSKKHGLTVQEFLQTLVYLPMDVAVLKRDKKGNAMTGHLPCNLNKELHWSEIDVAPCIMQNKDGGFMVWF
jgi:hypothetical protein